MCVSVYVCACACVYFLSGSEIEGRGRSQNLLNVENSPSVLRATVMSFFLKFSFWHCVESHNPTSFFIFTQDGFLIQYISEEHAHTHTHCMIFIWSSLSILSSKSSIHCRVSWRCVCMCVCLHASVYASNECECVCQGQPCQPCHYILIGECQPALLRLAKSQVLPRIKLSLWPTLTTLQIKDLLLWATRQEIRHTPCLHPK